MITDYFVPRPGMPDFSAVAPERREPFTFHLSPFTGFLRTGLTIEYNRGDIGNQRNARREKRSGSNHVAPAL
jgi:hypothetical protein